MGVINSFLVNVGFNADTHKVEAFKQGIKTATKATLTLGTALVGATAGLVAFTSRSLSALDDIKQLSNVTGESSLFIQQLGAIATTAGSSVEAAQASIANLNRTIGEAASGAGRGASAFKQYGLSAVDANGNIKSSSVLMEELRQKMQKMSKQERVALLEKLGIDRSLVQTLSMTNEEMEQAKKNAAALTLGTASAENTQIAQAFNDAMSEFRMILSAVAQFVAVHLAPKIKAFIDQLKEWFIINNALIKDGLSSLAKTLAGIIGFAVSLFKAINNIVTNTIGWKTAILAVVVALGYLKRAALTNPMLLIATAIIGAIMFIIALVDDLITEMNGGSSLLGDAWKPLIDILRAIGKWWGMVKPVFSEWLDETIATFSAIIGFIGDIFKSIIKIIKGFWGLIVGIFTGDKGKIKNGFKKIFSGIHDALVTVLNIIKTLLNNTVKWIGEIFTAVVDYISIPFKWAFDNVKERWDWLIEQFSNNPIELIFAVFKDVIFKPFALAFDLIRGAWGALLELFGLPTMTETFTKMTDGIVDAFSSAFDWVLSMWNKVKSGLGSLLSYIGIDIGSDKEVEISSLIENTRKSAEQAKTLPSGAITNATADNSTVNSNNKVTNNITINATDSAEGAKKSGEMLGKMLTDNYTAQLA